MPLTQGHNSYFKVIRLAQIIVFENNIRFPYWN